MCGRFALTATPEQTAAFLGLAELETFPARYNIAPTQPVLMVLAGPPRAPGSNLPDRQPMLVRWGLIPTWVKDTREFPLLFNARSEGAAQKASFKTAMRHRRALVPASGFYEWRQAGDKGAGGSKGQPYWIRPRHGGLVAFAGLIETYAEPGGSEMDTGAILTARASSGIANIHDRMPVVIEERDFARWLDCRTQEPRDVADLLRPAEPDFFEAVPVSDLVNKVANTGPEIQERGIVGPQAEKVRRQKSGGDDSQMTLF
ncbi:SOS response-associated peptidase [Mesorhizobium abyssinicae]|uniref:SOS response-associated peptidase n=1 Tax=Mesorhizobium abyssinicae TaxID=1209958 RepID=UPI00339412FA